MKRRAVLAIAVVVVAAVAVAASVLLAARRAATSLPAASTTLGPINSTTSTPGANTQPRPTTGPQPPADGAWIGAWVKPEVPTPDGRLAAVADFERKLGRPMDIVHVYHTFEEPWPSQDDRTFAAQGKTVLLSWAGADTRQIQSGRYDDVIRQRARDLKAWGAPVLLRWRWEMDRPNLQAEIRSAQDYIAAWKRIRGIFQQEGATNAAWVWCPLATGFVDGARAQPFYPGDDQVDWICADTYPTKAVKSFAEAIAPFMAWAKARPKPILIAEFGMKKERGEQVRQDWLAALRTYVKSQPQIKGLVYFDASRANRTDGKPNYDMSLRTAPGSMAVFADMAVRDPYFNVMRK